MTQIVKSSSSGIDDLLTSVIRKWEARVIIPTACQPIVNDIATLRSERDGFTSDLHEASPNQKPGIVQQIKKINQKIQEAEDKLADCVADAAPLPPLEASLRGPASISTTHPFAPGPFGGPLTARLLFDGFRSQVTIVDFTSISTAPFDTPLGTNLTTVSLDGGSVGNYSNGRISIFLRMLFSHTLNIGNSVLRVTLTTDGNGSPVQVNGDVTLVGTDTFDGGFLGGSTATITVTGRIDPSPEA